MTEVPGPLWRKVSFFSQTESGTKKEHSKFQHLWKLRKLDYILAHINPEDSLPGGSGCYECKVVASLPADEVIWVHNSLLGKCFLWYLYSLGFVWQKIINKFMWGIIGDGLSSLFYGHSNCLPGQLLVHTQVILLYFILTQCCCEKCP